MPQFTRITKVGAFSDDVANQINDNFAQLGTVLAAHGIDVHELVKDPDSKALPRRERTPLDAPELPKPGEPGGEPLAAEAKPEPDDKPKPDSDDKPGKGGKDGRHK